MDNSVSIEKIVIDESSVLYVKPHQEDFSLIYRSANGVRWNKNEKSLFFIAPIEHDDEILKVISVIVNAIEEEYGKRLYVNHNTFYKNISQKVVDDIKSQFNK